MVSERPLVYSANRESHRFVHQRDDDRPNSKRESEFSPTYAELPPREIFVTSNSQQESVQSGGKMDSTESKTKLDDTGKAKIFTFEGLTPVSTIDDTREEAVSEHRSNNDTDGREVVKSPTGTSALTNSETSIGSRRTNPQIDTSSCILVKSTSSVKDKVAAWERRATTGTATTIQNDLEGDDEVPFDEEPMTPRTVLKKLNDAKIQTDSQLKPEEELPTLCTKEQESPENSDNEKPGTTSSNKPSSVVDKDSSLLDQEDQAEQEETEEREPEIVEAPSDEAHEVVLRKVVDGVCSNDFCQRLSSDEICKGVSKLLNLA